MNRLLLSVLACATLLPAYACNAVVEANLFSPNPDEYLNGAPPIGNGGSGAGGAPSSGSGSTGDLPCEVAAVLAAHCDSCHAASIPPLLRSRADFVAASTSDPTKNLAEVSLERMENAASPMPPVGVPPAADVQTFADWLAAGLPAGDCGGTGAGGAGGSPYDVAPTCTSMQTWNNGDNDGAQMYPGRACNDCHADEKPNEIFAFAGTVYPTAHEPDDCYGVGAGEATVEVTDANGVVSTATTNSSGNFSRKGSFAFPLTVRVIAGSESLAMVTPLMQGDGDCNLCHNQSGAHGAPGRIILPF